MALSCTTHRTDSTQSSVCCQFCHLREKCVRLVFAKLTPTDSGTFNYTFIILVKWWVDTMIHSNIGQPSFMTFSYSFALMQNQAWNVFNSSQITIKALPRKKKKIQLYKCCFWPWCIILFTGFSCRFRLINHSVHGCFTVTRATGSTCPSLICSPAFKYDFQGQTGSVAFWATMWAELLCMQSMCRKHMTQHLNYGHLVGTMKHGTLELQQAGKACVKVRISNAAEWKEDTAHFWRSLHFQKWGLSRADIN